MDNNFYIDDWYVQPSLNKITLGEKDWKLEPKIMAVLITLANNSGEVVTREALLDSVWGNTVVVDMVVTRAVSELRSIFRNDPSNAAIIETIPKKGYRLIIPVVLAKIKNKDTPDRTNFRQYILPLFAVIIIVSIISFVLPKNKVNQVSTSYNIKPLTSLNGWEYNPNISQDGKSVVFVWKDMENNYAICTKSLNDESFKVLISSKSMYFSPVWSKDKNLITYYKNEGGKVTICTIPSYGGNEEEFIQTQAKLAGLSWAPDSKFLAFVDIDTLSKKSVINLYNSDSQKITRLTKPNDIVWGDNTPRFSPDGKSLAFIRYVSEGNQDIYTINIESREEKQCTNLNSNIYGFDWKNNNTLVLSTNFDGNTSIWEMNVNSGIKKKIPLGINNQNPVIQNNFLVLEKWTTSVDIWKTYRYTNDSTHTQPFLTSTKFDFSPSFSNDNKSIAFVSNRSGSYEVWQSNIDGDNILKLTSIDKSLISNPRWSPNNQLIAFDAKNYGKSNIYFKNISDRDLFSFTDTTANDIAPFWSHSGKWLYFTSDRNNEWQIWKKSVNNGGHLEQITSNGGYYSQESLDGKYLYYSKFKKSGIWKLDLTTKKEEKILNSLAISDYGNWKLMPSGIYYVQRLIKNPGIYFYDFKDKESSLIVKTDKSIPTYDNSLTVSVDEKTILFGQANGYNGDLIIVDNF